MKRLTTEEVDAIIEKLKSEGKHIEAGWESLKLTCLHDDCPSDLADIYRKIFYCGASWIFGDIIASLDTSDKREPTEQDYKMMDSIQHEIEEFDFELQCWDKAMNAGNN